MTLLVKDSPEGVQLILYMPVRMARITLGASTRPCHSVFNVSHSKGELKEEYMRGVIRVLQFH